MLSAPTQLPHIAQIASPYFICWQQDWNNWFKIFSLTFWLIDTERHLNSIMKERKKKKSLSRLLWCCEVTIYRHSFKVEKFMKEAFWHFATKETSGPQCHRLQIPQSKMTQSHTGCRNQRGVQSFLCFASFAWMNEQ